MKYLIISADYKTTGIKDKYSGEVCQADLGVSDSLWADISAWVEEYAVITLMTPEERITEYALNKINELDNKGLELAERFKKELKNDVKISYFSEGKLKYLRY